MLEKMIVRNFQRHKKLEIEFDPLITAITGSTDVGKSAIVRALKWACLNTPSGDAFISHGKKRTTVTLFFDGLKLVRRRGGSKAPFSFEGQDYRALGKGKMPDEVSTCLAVCPMNFQSQMDMPFWFSEPGGKISKELNRIVNLEIIDNSLQNIAQSVRKEKARYDSLQILKNEARQRKEETEWIKKAEKEWKTLEACHSEMTETQDDIDVLSDLITKIRTHQKHKRRIAKTAESLDIVLATGTKPSEIVETLNGLSSLIHKIKSKERQLKETEEALMTVNAKLSKYKECPTCGNLITTK